MITRRMSNARRFLMGVSGLCGICFCLGYLLIGPEFVLDIAKLNILLAMGLIIPCSAASATIIQELARAARAGSSMSNWDDARHFRVLTVLWVVLLVIQTSGLIVAHHGFTEHIWP